MNFPDTFRDMWVSCLWEMRWEVLKSIRPRILTNDRRQPCEPLPLLTKTYRILLRNSVGTERRTRLRRVQAMISISMHSFRALERSLALRLTFMNSDEENDEYRNREETEQ